MSESNRGPECSDHVKGQSLAWTVYILLCRNGKFYVGSTGDLDRRLKEHFSGNGGGHYTKCNPPVRLAYTEEFPSRDRAERRERQLKGWTHAKKQALTDGDLDLLRKL
ncbi:MAG: GIY-YIG nuclease family protein [Phycisphaerae bacterium]